MKKSKRLLRQNGSALLQVIAAMFILSSGLTGALSLIIGAMRANDTQMHRLIATNLAQEGLEMMHNMRDTNWMVYPSNLRECWNFWPDKDENYEINAGDGICEANVNTGQNNHPWAAATGKDPWPHTSPTPTPTNPEQIPQKFIIDVDLSNFRWNLISEDNFDESGNFDYRDGFLLFKRTLKNGPSFYSHNKYDDDPNTDDIIVEPTPYTRSIGLYYIDSTTPNNYDDSDFPIIRGGYFPADKAKDNRLLVVSRVEWSNGGVTHNVTLSTILTDYLNREGWDS